MLFSKSQAQITESELYGDMTQIADVERPDSRLTNEIKVSLKPP